MPLPIDNLAAQPAPLDDRPPTIYVDAKYLDRALARLRFAQVGERAAIEHAAALAAELDTAKREVDFATSRGNLLAEILVGRERYIAVMQRRTRARRSPHWRLARTWRRLRRSRVGRWLVAAAVLLAIQVLIVALPTVGGW